MLQQTQVTTVIPYFERWMARFPDLETLASADEDAVLSLWQGLGYYSRARNLHAAARAIHSHHGGQIPHDPIILKTLPGVGPYSAGAIASFGFDRPAAAVDANIARVLARLGNIQTPVDSGPGKAAVWALAESLLPQEGGRLHTSALMEVGALLCLPARPQCLLCPLKPDCTAPRPEILPLKAARKKTESITEDAAWIASGESILLERQSGRRATGLWKLPPLPPSTPTAGPALFSTVYGFTHHRVTLRVFPAPEPAFLSDSLRWFPKQQILANAALVAAHRRAITALLNPTPAPPDGPRETPPLAP